ncbi:MAG: glycosyltransferase family 4 protein [Candidatus Binatia bacterium]
MRIAQISPLFESVPPKCYGGTERVVANLTEELTRRGHEVTLFASGDSRTRARLVACAPSALRLLEVRDSLAYHVCMLDEVLCRADEFDVIHSHADYLAYPFLARCPTPNVTTLHGRLDLADLEPIYRRFRDVPLVSISDSQRRPLPHAGWMATVHHGLPLDEFTFQWRPEPYLVFLGRMSREKRVDRAIAIATRVGLPLKIAAKIDRADRIYFHEVVEPLLDNPLIEYVGEIGGEAKNQLLGNALALLFPIDWPEPFGLVMIEAMACGTPVVAFGEGSVPEVVQDGVSGFIVNDIEQAVEAVARIDEINRVDCRGYFEERFGVGSMVDAYLDVYDRVMDVASEPLARHA